MLLSLNNNNKEKEKTDSFILKEYFTDFIVNEIFIFDEQKIICSGNKFNIENSIYNFEEKIKFSTKTKNLIKEFYENILKIELNLQFEKEEIIKCIKLTENKLTENDLLKKIRSKNIPQNIEKIKSIYLKLETLLNEPDIIKYFYLPVKEKRKEIYQNLRKNPTLIYEIIENKLLFPKNTEILTVFSEISDKILKITKTTNKSSQFHLTVRKTNKTTSKLASELQNKFSNISFAGNKDKRGITFQRFSIKTNLKDLILYNSSFYLNDNYIIKEDDNNNNNNKEEEEEEKRLIQFINNNIKTPNISLSQFVSCQKNIGLGDLKGNKFKIIIREIKDFEIKKKKFILKNNFIIPNLFGSQRFGNKGNNNLVGKYLYEKNYSKAYEIYSDLNIKKSNLDSKIFFNKKIKRETKMLFEHSYQSYIFNERINKLLNNELKEVDFLFFNKKKISLNKFYQLIKENNEDDLLNIELSLPFTKKDIFRKLFFKPKEFIFEELINEKNSCILKFILNPSCYATTLIDYLFKD